MKIYWGSIFSEGIKCLESLIVKKIQNFVYDAQTIDSKLSTAAA